MTNELLTGESDIFQEFEMLWRSCAVGRTPQFAASRMPTARTAVPHAPRDLRAEDLRHWLFALIGSF